MILANPIRDFLGKAAHYAKEQKNKELNLLEADILAIEQQLIDMRRKGLISEDAAYLESRLGTLKHIVKYKKEGY